ncbi:hypothetical protein G210_4296 [Candida maltosa Xu316]|uniref:Uncharacterized protein n=1 Tax=Candida maltosa (strain Xu316) TaxID=1245528 RepID=M3JRU8_CANMX|nr:hypothetical protein G210_4296 [Candida maltosa Xu316]
MATSYTTMERTSIDIMSKIARILQHTWKYGSATEHFAQQFVFLFESIFTDLDIPDTFKDEQINKFLLESFDDLYFHRQIQTTVHNIFLGLDNAKLKYYIVEILEDKYGYDIPSAFFVIGVCSLGLQLYRDRIENARKVETLNKVEKKDETRFLFFFGLTVENRSTQPRTSGLINY